MRWTGFVRHATSKNFLDIFVSSLIMLIHHFCFLLWIFALCTTHSIILTETYFGSHHSTHYVSLFWIAELQIYHKTTKWLLVSLLPLYWKMASFRTSPRDSCLVFKIYLKIISNHLLYAGFAGVQKTLAASVYYTERKPKRGGLGTRLYQTALLSKVKKLFKLQ